MTKQPLDLAKIRADYEALYSPCEHRASQGCYECVSVRETRLVGNYFGHLLALCERMCKPVDEDEAYSLAELSGYPPHAIDVHVANILMNEFIRDRMAEKEPT